jgi:lipid-binding SYLF domain-containing protein
LFLILRKELYMGTSKRMLGLASATLALCLFAPAGCQQTEAEKAEHQQAKLAKAEGKQETLRLECEAAMHDMRQTDPSIDDFLKRAYGYAVFPSVAKGGLVVGAANGKGILFEQGRAVGYCDLTQASVGFLAGGQRFRELVVLQTPDAMQKFRSGQFSLGGDISLVALKTGSAASAQFKDGVAVFAKPAAGAMFDISAAGQKFTVAPMAGQAQ